MSETISEYVPQDLDAMNWGALEPLIRGLLDRPVENAADLERWLVDRSELEAAYSETQATLYINMTCDTGDEDAQKAYTAFIESIPPKFKPLAFELDRRQTELSERFPLDAERFGVLMRDTSADVSLFRDENVPIQTELSKLSQRYDRIMGEMTVEFEGEEKTLPQMSVYFESTDRSVRELAWRAVQSRRVRDREAVDGIYDEMIAQRDTMARNAGFDNYVGYAFESKHRFDYTPAHCEAFHTACEEVIVPLLRRLDADRKEKLGVESLRPWDLAVDPKGRAPLTPFKGGADLVSKTASAFEKLDPRLASMFAELGDGANTSGASTGALLDLDTRKGKAPGGYQYMRDRQRKPFIFMNAAGLHRDVETMVHEAGHAFHSMVCVDEPLLHYRHSPIEFAEVASMTMELLSMPYWGGKGGFYPDEADLARAQRKQLESSVTLLPWIATIDAFQHWIYAHPKHTRDERTKAWIELDERFGHATDWSGLDAERASMWQRQGHLFGVPFYYIEYGIAQLGALGLWLTSIEKGESAAVEAYLKGLRLGGSRPLPDLFAASGLPFDFGPDTVRRLVDRVEAELAKLPE
ncbi:MAG: M3 family oligoendopeptidase [Planctomycetota bacterium]